MMLPMVSTKIKRSLFFQNVFCFHFSTVLQEFSLLSLIILPYVINNRQLLISQIGRGSDNSLNLIKNKPKILSNCQFQNFIFVNQPVFIPISVFCFRPGKTLAVVNQQRKLLSRSEILILG